MSWKEKIRNLGFPGLLSGAGVCVFLLVAFFSLGKALASDEVEFAAAVRGILAHGFPIYYMGHQDSRFLLPNDLWIFHATGAPDFQYGLWHSPLYLYCMAIFYKIFGLTNYASRLPGFVCLILDLFLLRGILQAQTKSTLFTEKDKKILFALLVFFTCIHPFVLQMGFMVDYDNTIMTTLSLLFFHEYLRLRERGEWQVDLWLSVLVAFAAWGKEYAPVYLFSALVLYEALNRRWLLLTKNALRFAFGALLFVLSWRLYCAALHLPSDYIWHFSYTRRVNSADGLASIFDYMKHGSFPEYFFALKNTSIASMLWSSLFFFLLAALAIGKRILAYSQKKQCEAVDLLFLFALAVLGATKIVRPSILSLKYEYPAYPALIFAVAYFVYETLRLLPPPQIKKMALLTLLASGIFIYLGDPLLVLPQALGFLVFTLLVSVFVFLFCRVVKGMDGKYAFVAALVSTMLANQLALDFQQHRPYLTPVNYVDDYGKVGMEQLAERLAELPLNFPIVDKDIGFHLSRLLKQENFRWFAMSNMVQAYSAGEAVFQAEIPSNSSHLVLMANVPAPVIESFSKKFVLKEAVGDYLIFERR